ncbi:MAG: choice-of-anchor Q domain-containing protein [bacterium]
MKLRSLRFFLFCILSFPTLCRAATLTVTDCGDTVPGGATGQLRKLINQASAGDTIVIPACTITLQGAASEDGNQTGDLDFSIPLSLRGSGAGVSVIDGGGNDRVIDVIASVNVAFSNLTLQNGKSPSGEDGGGIRNIGNLTLSNATVTGNHSQGEGGGIATSLGNLTLTNVVLNHNNSDFSGGGIKNSGSTLSLTNSTVDENTAGNFAGGINNDSGTLNLINSTISANTASGGVGGGLCNNATFNLTNSTISGNTATGGNGGGLYNANGTSTLNNGTLALNTGSAGGGVFTAAGSVIAANTLLAGNTGAGSNDCSGTLTSQGYNLIQDPVGCALTGTSTGNITGVNPNLLPLADNGGATFTHALPSGSAALDKGNPVSPGSGGSACQAADQRGLSRPQGSQCDIGAFEAGAIAQLSALSLSFPDQEVNKQSASQSLTLTNAGILDLDITGISTSTQFGQTNNCGSTLAPGASCQIEVFFTPTTEGPQNGNLTMSDNAAGSPRSIALSGSGTGHSGGCALTEDVSPSSPPWTLFTTFLALFVFTFLRKRA